MFNLLQSPYYNAVAIRNVIKAFPKEILMTPYGPVAKPNAIRIVSEHRHLD